MTISAGTRFGQYEVTAPLGKGGMGEVCLAEDTRLQRKVALKLLPAEFTRDAERLRRFALEAKTASGLNHPNIITIYDIGAAHNTHYIATEFIAGQTLRDRLQQPMTLDAVLDIALQIANALAAAHEAGIIHRDIKPENVMLRSDGIVKVLDFGLAKLAEVRNAECGARNEDADTLLQAEPNNPQSAIPNPHSTAVGIVMGTASYMSPEQARGEKVDARSDLFSLGIVLYEMIAGQQPFTGVNMLDVIGAILHQEPAPIVDAPVEVQRIVTRALQKDRAARYQTAQELALDLKELKDELAYQARAARTSSESQTALPRAALGAQASRLPLASASEANSVVRENAEEEALPSPSERATLHALAAGGTPALPGAPRTSKYKILIAVAALVLLVVAAFFYFKRQPALTDKDTILLADFTNTTNDPVFDGTLKQALAVHLGQSPFLNLFADERVRETLRLMNRSPDERITPTVGREICQRQGLKALLTGTIASLGRNYVINLEAINGQTGDVLAREQGEAEGKEQVLRSLGEAATRLREKLGESLSSIQRFDKPLQQATTAKLEAFKAWSLGLEYSYSGSVMEAIPFYKRAVELDPEFAQAYSVLSVVHWATGRPGLAAEYAEKGYRLRDRVSEFEKLRITNFYHAFATGDLNKRIEVVLLLKGRYPREWGTPTDLALTYNMIGQFDQAVAEAREAIRRNPNFAPAHRALGLALLSLNRFAEAREALTQALQQKLDTPDFHAILYQIAFTDGDTAGMQQQLDWAKGKPNEYIAFDWQTGAAACAGQWRQAQEFSRRAIDLAGRGDTTEVAARYATEQALRGAVFGDCRQARVEVAQGLKLARGRMLLSRAALALSLCGETHQAQQLVDEVSKLYPEDTLMNAIWLPLIRAALELQRGNAAQAIEQLQATTRYEAAAEFWPQYLRSQAYLKLGRGAEAASEFQKILDHRGWAPTSPLYPLAHLGLARAALLQGDTAKAQKSYQDFFALWKDADADLPVLIEAKKEYEKVK